MRLKRFRVWKYRNIQDSGDVQLDSDLTCIVGKNQSGKTTLLRALHKFNPRDKSEKYSLSRDWPRGERRAKDASQVVCAATFELTAIEKQELSEILSRPLHADRVTVTKNYAGQFEIEFESEPDLFPGPLHPNEIDTLCERLPSPVDLVGPMFAELAKSLGEEVALIVREGRYGDLSGLAEQHAEALNTARFPGYPQQSQNEEAFVAAHAQKIGEMIGAFPQLPKSHASALEYIVRNLPVFIYMDDYGEFQGSIFLDQLRNRRLQKRLSAEDDTALRVLRLSGLDLNKMIDQGNSDDPEMLRERQYDLDDAARSLTKEVAGRWGQTPYRIEFRCDGQRFSTEIEETSKKIGMIPLEEQSKGFRWFFSFDLRFMDGSGGSFENCVLLLDEPGLHLHPGGQGDLLQRLDAYATTNVLIYTTHLPFLVDLREPERIHVIRQQDGYATVTDDLGASGPDEKMTLQAALGMKLNQHALVAESNLVVEGMDDASILSELSDLLRKAGKASLPDDVEITASSGASEAVFMATFMAGQGLKVVALFDSDAEGRQQEERLRTKWITRYKNSRSSSLLLGAAAGVTGDFGIEDIFPEAYYAQKANEAHGEKLASVHEDAIPLIGTGPIVDRLQRGAEKIGIAFNKGAVAKVIRRDIRAMQDASKLDAKTVERAERLFAAICLELDR
jgi:energy-coupling factor transporter ATP-binding protein EcfA2